MKTTERIEQNRKNIEKWFEERFFEERKLKEHNGIIQGAYVEVDMSKMRTRKWKEIDELLVIAIIPQNNTFIGMDGSMRICQAPIEIIK